MATREQIIQTITQLESDPYCREKIYSSNLSATFLALKFELGLLHATPSTYRKSERQERGARLPSTLDTQWDSFYKNISKTELIAFVEFPRD